MLFGSDSERILFDILKGSLEKSYLSIGFSFLIFGGWLPIILVHWLLNLSVCFL